jgi:hypothetical protein
VTLEAAVERPREADCGEAEVFMGEGDFPCQFPHPVTPEAAVEQPREADCGEAEVFVGEGDFLVGHMMEEVVDKGTGEISMLLAIVAGLAAFNARRGGEGG